jgi:acid phosphatase (class A)
VSNALRAFVLTGFGVVLALRPTAGQNAAPARPPARTGYLAPAQVPDVTRIVLPAPASGDPRFAADMAIYRATRTLEGSPRWAMAIADDNVSTNGMLSAFSCPLGLAQLGENAPRVRALISRANVDTLRPALALKRLYQHKRPFQVEAGKVCLSDRGRAALETDPDYPSGHTTASWEAGLILAELAPDASSDILARARAFGESRIVCGVHNASAVEAGRMTSTAVFAAQHASPDFRADMDAAREELAALRAQAQKPARCTDEAATAAMRVF